MISVLLVENDPGDARRMEELLGEARPGQFELTCVEGVEEAGALPGGKGFDVAILDLSRPAPPGPPGPDTVERFRASVPGVPVVVLAGAGDEDTALKALESGAQDYVVKGELDSRLLARSVLYAIERHRTLKELEAARKRTELLDLVENAMFDMMFVVEPDGRIVECNALARRTFSASRPEMLALNIRSLFAPEEGEDWDSIVARARKESKWRGTLLASCDPDTRIPVEFTLSRPKNDGRMICFARDVTREREVDRMKSEFISIASHELRTPLTSIKNAVDIILRKKAGEVTEAQAKFLSMAERNITRLSALINDILDISKIESGRLELDYVEMDIGASVEHVFATLRPQAEQKSVSLVSRISAAVPVIFADSSKIEEVLINLVDNAIKFSRDDGTVTVEADILKDSNEVPWGVKGFIEVSVADNGVGISAEQMAHLFEKFYQAKSSLSGRLPGTGLGLAICKGIAEIHGGRIRCESAEGEGSRFSLTLPVMDRERVFFNSLQKEISRAKRDEMPLSILVLKIKHFEDSAERAEGGGSGRVREDGGEKTLGMIMRMIQELGIKRTDKISLSGFEGEIILVMPYTDSFGVNAARRRIERNLLEKARSVERHIITSTFAIASSTFPDDGSTAEELVNVARRNLLKDRDRELKEGL